MSNFVDLLDFYLIYKYDNKGKGSVNNMLYPSIDKLLNIVDSKYKLVILASKRSKQMLENNHYQMKESEYKNKKSLGRALEETGAGLIKIIEVVPG